MYRLSDDMLIQMFGQANYDYAIAESWRIAGNGFYDIILAVLLAKVIDDQRKIGKLLNLTLSL